MIDNKLAATNLTEYKQVGRNNRTFQLIPHNYLPLIIPLITKAFLQYCHHYNCNYNYNWNSSTKSSNYEINVHLVRQWALPGSTSTNAPEGCHQDGAQFIISACVLNLENVNDEGGISRVYDETQKKTLFEQQLEPGQFLLHDDMHYWHDISKIESKDGINPAVRDIIGLDFIPLD